MRKALPEMLIVGGFLWGTMQLEAVLNPLPRTPTPSVPAKTLLYETTEQQSLTYRARCVGMRQTTKQRLECLRSQLRAECISWGGLAELQGLASEIEPGDVELLEAAGVPEFDEKPTSERGGKIIPRMRRIPKRFKRETL